MTAWATFRALASTGNCRFDKHWYIC